MEHTTGRRFLSPRPSPFARIVLNTTEPESHRAFRSILKPSGFGWRMLRFKLAQDTLARKHTPNPGILNLVLSVLPRAISSFLWKLPGLAQDWPTPHRTTEGGSRSLRAACPPSLGPFHQEGKETYLLETCSWPCSMPRALRVCADERTVAQGGTSPGQDHPAVYSRARARTSLGGPFSSERKGPCPSAVYGRGCHGRLEGENATPALHVTLCCSSRSTVSCFHVNKSLLVQREPGLLSVNEVIYFSCSEPSRHK